MQELAQMLRRIRKDKGLTQEALAERVDVSPIYISQIENETRSPSWKFLVGFARTTRTPLVGLLRTAGLLDSDTAELEDEIADLVATVPEFAEIFEFSKQYPDRLPEVVRFARYLLSGEEVEEEGGESPQPRRQAAEAPTG